MTTAPESTDGISRHLTIVPNRKRQVNKELAAIGTDRPLFDLAPGVIPVKRERGRPRTFTDDDVYKAIPLAIAEHGHQALTLALVAEKIGATPQALIRRFGSRDGMVRAYLAWTNELNRKRVSTARSTFSSPLAALYQRIIGDLETRGDELGRGTAHLNLITFWAAARSDPESRELLATRYKEVEAEGARFLQAAQDAGELLPHDPARLSHLMMMAINGTMLRQTHAPAEMLAQALRDILDDLFEPYRPKR
jgi:AcrR family transcriptional regulator